MVLKSIGVMSAAKIVAVMQEDEFRSTWVANKAVYRTRLAIETGGMYDRLNEHKFWQEHDCILISTQGVPSRACRRFSTTLTVAPASAVSCAI